MTEALATLAVIGSGLLAGLSLDRSTVGLPAWRRVGVTAWAAYSRHADLGYGLVLYPILGAGAPFLSLATGAAFVAEAGPDTAAVAVAAAAGLSVAHIIATARAAPHMLRVRRSDDPQELERSFAGFERWQAARALLQVLTFGASVWALVALLAA